MPLSTGSRLGAHEILGLLGAGGMGEVYLAQDTKLNRRVAIKVLPEAYARDPERIARFHREAQAVAALNHANIAAIYELAEATLQGREDAGVIKYLVLELVEGDTLADRLSRGPVPVEEALRIAIRILEALEAAHEKGICHRDLKPANVKVGADGTVKVLDFGLAKFLQSGLSAPHVTQSPTLSLAGTYPGVILGTAGYMSPEQAKGFEADQRSDIFSFGCILFELLTGRRAFEGETASEILASVLKTEPDYTALPPRLNPRLIELLHRCLEKNPKKRWHAAADVRVEIESLLGRAVVPNDPRVQTIAQRSWWTRASALLATGLLGAAIAGYTAWTMRPKVANRVMRFAIALPEGQNFTNTGRLMLAVSPDGTRLVYVANQRLFLRSMSSLDALPIAGSEAASGGVLNPVFSPDGQSVAFYSNDDRRLKRLAVAGGAAVTICPADPPYGMNWDESGLIVGQGPKGVMRVSADGGTPEVIATVGADETASMPQMLPGGSALLFAVKKTTDGWDKGRIVVQPFGGGDRKILIEGGADGRYVPTGHLVYALSGVLYAVPFDIRTLATTGGSVPVIEGVRRSTGPNTLAAGAANFSYSAGVLAYAPGPISGTTNSRGLASFDRKGGFEPLSLPPGEYSSPRVSADGKLVAFERADGQGTDVWIYETSGGGSPRRLTFGGASREPIWSPDGQWVAFQSDREGDRAIFRQRADGAGATERLTRPEKDVSHSPQSWSGNGRDLLFSVQKDQQSTLWLLSLNDRQLTRFGDALAREAVFSPDGRWILYQVNTTGSIPTAFLEPFPRTGAKYQIPVEAMAGHPFWSPKGDEIIMNTGQYQSTVIAVKTAPQVSFGQPVPFPRFGRTEPNPSTARRGVDMLPDGQRVIGVMSSAPSGSGDSQQSQINIVLNWFDDLRQRVPTR